MVLIKSRRERDAVFRLDAASEDSHLHAGKDSGLCLIASAVIIMLRPG